MKPTSASSDNARFSRYERTLYPDDAEPGAKMEISRDLIRDTLKAMAGVVSTQVLNEYLVIATKKLRVEPGVAAQKVELLTNLEGIPITLQLVREALDLFRLEPIQYWDALIIRAAQSANCRVLYTEDLQHGRRFGNLEVRNPFLTKD
jgi:predicted nucleic acid-binding protein